MSRRYIQVRQRWSLWTWTLLAGTPPCYNRGCNAGIQGREKRDRARGQSGMRATLYSIVDGMKSRSPGSPPRRTENHNLGDQVRPCRSWAIMRESYWDSDTIARASVNSRRKADMRSTEQGARMNEWRRLEYRVVDSRYNRDTT